MGSSSTLAVRNVNDDGTGYLYVSPSSKLKISSLLESCSKIFKGAELVLSNVLSRVDLTRSVSVYGRLNLENSPSVYVGKDGGTFSMFPGSSPSALTFGDLRLEPNGKLRLLNYDTSTPEKCRWIVESTKARISLGSGSKMEVSCPLTMEGDQLVTEQGSVFTIHGNGSLSNVTMNSVSLDGKLEAGFLSIENGWTELNVGKNGHFRFLPHREFRIDRMIISGKLQVESPLRLRGKNAAVVKTLNIKSGGTVEFDVPPSSSHLVSIVQNEKQLFTNTNLTNTSDVHAEYVTINGSWTAKNLRIEPGWRQLTVGSAGRFEFFPVGHFAFHQLFINGNFKALTAIVVKGLTQLRLAHFNVGPSGVVSIETREQTTIHSELVTVDGTVSVGNLSIGSRWDQFDVSGKFYFQTDEPFNIGTTRVKGLVTTSSSLGPSTPLTGELFVVEAGGKVSNNYQGPPIGKGEGTVNTTVFMDNITVHGILEAGSLHVSTKSLAIGSTGVISVDWGGAAGGEGLGAGQPSTQGGSGASHGGRGGKGYGTRAVNLPYGNIYRQGTWGSGGGHGQGGKGGGRGGGRIVLFVDETLEVNGVIQMNGQPAQVRSFSISKSIGAIQFSQSFPFGVLETLHVKRNGLFPVDGTVAAGLVNKLPLACVASAKVKGKEGRKKNGRGWIGEGRDSCVMLMT